jgi:hypothetical protein
MFENIYALKNLQTQETSKNIVDLSSKIFDNSITSSEALKKYAMSGIIQDTYLSGINIDSDKKFDIYFEEFGTIMRECAYFNIKYDKAYPAFIAYIAPTFNKEKTYTVSGFRAGAYGAEFLIFNNTDKSIVLDETSGNYLRIIGITFTQNTSNVLTVDDYFKEISNFFDPNIENNTLRLINDKFYTNKIGIVSAGLNSVEFLNYNDILVNYSLFNDKTLEGSILIKNDKSEKSEVTFLNNIFLV